MKAFIKKIKHARGFVAGICITSIFFLFIRAGNTDSYFEISKNLDIFATLFKQLNTYYVDPIEPGKMVKTGIDAMLDELDPYTNYITEADIEDFEFQRTGKYGGIGATMHKKGEDIYVGDVYENSPAQKAGLHPGDLIISIDDKPLKGKSIDDISVLLKGSPGTQVTLSIKDVYSGTVSPRMITRGEIELSSVPFAGLAGPAQNIAYARLTQFTPACSKHLRSALDSLKKVQPNLKGVILDLRNNPGGLLDEAVAVCNIFLEKGSPVVTTKGRMHELDREYKTRESAWDTKIPLTVIVNHSSASASEIVAGTMQDLDRGVIIGERSYGKGLVQNTVSLGYNSKLKLTIQKYYTPSGRCIQAIDYSHRNADGSVGYVPDSLKKTFKTKNGRTVLSGGGVEPEVNLKDELPSRLAITLYTKNYLFDYATEYKGKHPSIPDAGTFTLTDADFNDFSKWLTNKDYAYDTETEEAFDTLQQVAIREQYYDEAKAEFAALHAKISHDKKQDLVKHKEEVKDLLENEIVSRYYFLRGRIQQSLKNDKEFARAIELVEKPAQYQALLTKK
ncbi:MAG: peptidase S41 [Bacteroidetes bacterium 46-16]|nr:MAG: peptidase S41 [Bacteroidetes bacterium 46-16]